MSLRTLLLFFALTFSITWTIIGSYILFPETTVSLLGEISGTHPAFFVATWSPAIGAVFIIHLTKGVEGLRAFLARLCLWRCSLSWVMFVTLVIPLVFSVGSLLKGGPVLAPIPANELSATLFTLGIMLFLGPVEELGWRGFAQPLLQRHMAPLWAGVIIGGVWGIWHLPAFFLAGTLQSGWSFAPFFMGNVLLAVIVTPLFNSTRGSLLWPILFHWQLINPFWADAQPYDTYLLVPVAVAVILLNRDQMLMRGSGVTEIGVAQNATEVPK